MGVEIVAHRGANTLAPVNTLSAARACLEMQVDWLELDVRTSSDGKLYNMHDRTLARTTGGAETRALSQLDSREIDSLDAGGWFAPEFAGERVPRIETLIEEFLGKMRFYFDVKEAELGALVELVERYDIRHQSFFWFWNPLTARAFRKLAPHLSLKINAGTVAGLRRARRRYGAQIIECDFDALSDRLVERCHEEGMKLMVRIEDNDPDGFRRIIESGADMVNLDHVAEFRKVNDNGRRVE